MATQARLGGNRLEKGETSPPPPPLHASLPVRAMSRGAGAACRCGSWGGRPRRVLHPPTHTGHPHRPPTCTSGRPGAEPGAGTCTPSGATRAPCQWDKEHALPLAVTRVRACAGRGGGPGGCGPGSCAKVSGAAVVGGEGGGGHASEPALLGASYHWHVMRVQCGDRQPPVPPTGK
jgi:hypothetical protein